MTRTSLAILNLVIGVGVGLVGGLPFWDTRPATIAPAASGQARQGAAHEAASDVAFSRARVAVREAPVARNRRETRPGGDADADLDADLRAAIASVRARPQRQGDGVIRGLVRTSEGFPVEGVQVFATSRPDPDGATRQYEALKSADLEAYLNEAAAAFHRSRSLDRVAITDASGMYALTGLQNATYDLAASGRGLKLDSRNRWNVSPGATVDFTAQVQAEVPVVVQFRDGRSPAQAMLLISHAGTESVHVWTPSRALVGFEPGRSRLQAQIADTHQSPFEVVDLVLGEETQAVTLVLEERRALAGRVTVPEGGSEAISVRYLRVNPATEVDENQLARRGASTWVQNGRFRINDIEPGTYLIGAGRRYDAVAVTELVEVVDGAVELELALPPLDPTTTITCLARGPDGALLEAVTAKLFFDTHGAGLRQSPLYVARQPDGSFLFEAPAEAREALSGAGLGACALEVEAEGLGTRRVDLEAGAGSVVTVQFDAPASLRVRVNGYVGSGLEGDVAARLLDENGGVRKRLKIDADGLAKIDVIEPGSYTVALELHEQERGGRVPLVRAPVQVGPGENVAEVSIPVLHTLTVTFDQPAPGMVSMHPETDGASGALVREPDENGRATFERLPSGSYTVKCMTRGAARTLTVSVPGARVVHFPMDPLNALAVSVTDPTGALSAAGFVDGDLIVGTGDEAFEELEQMQIAFMSAMRRDETLLTVQRGRARIELRIAGRSLSGGQRLGGRVRPTSR